VRHFRSGIEFAFEKKARVGRMRRPPHLLAQFPLSDTRTEPSMTLVIYLVGWLILIAGIAWALITLHVSQHTVAIVVVIMAGVAVITAAKRIRHRDR
jgi:hypothetical protein